MSQSFFCVKRGKSATEILEMLREAFGEHSLSRTAVFDWHSRFQAGRVSAEDNKRLGRPSATKTTENDEKFENYFMKTAAKQPMSSQTVGISYGVCQEILTENLNMSRIAAKFFPRLLTNDQKQRHVNVCLELREKANENPTFICRFITGDEIWIYGYNPVTKQQSSQWKCP
jgi:histone-lysine N-methyltransferase SETMAR